MSTIVSESNSTHTSNYRLDVEAFSLYGGQDGGHVHFEDDGNLLVHYDPTGTRAHLNTFAGLVVVELGIDGYPAHRVRAEARRGTASEPDEYVYDGDRLAALTDAIDALTAVRDQLEAMRAPTELRAVERNAFDIGRDVGRLETEGVRRVH